MIADHAAATPSIEERLDRVVRLLAALVTEGITRMEQILTLSGIGLQPKEIASILGVSPNQASVTIYDATQGAAKLQQKTAKA